MAKKSNVKPVALARIKSSMLAGTRDGYGGDNLEQPVKWSDADIELILGERP